MLIPIFSDLHVNNYADQELYDNTIKVIEQMFQVADKVGSNVILFGGDLYHTSSVISTKVITRVIKTFSTMFEDYPNISFISISGNHDHATVNTPDNPAVSALEHLSDIFSNFILIDNCELDIPTSEGNHLSIYGVPYYQHKEHLHQQIPSKEYDIVLIHNTPKTENMNFSYDFEASDVNARLTLCGHIHRREKITNQLTLIGTPLQHSFKEGSEPKGFLLLNSEDLSYQFVDLGYPIKEAPKAQDEAQVKSHDENSKYSLDLPVKELITNYHSEAGITQKHLQYINKFI